jgi:hypothetical protein
VAIGKTRLRLLIVTDRREHKSQNELGWSQKIFEKNRLKAFGGCVGGTRGWFLVWSLTTGVSELTSIGAFRFKSQS